MLNCQFQYQTTDFVLDVNLQMQSQLLGMIGASGSGKSSFLKNVVGLLQPQHGHIQFQNQTLFNATNKVVVPMHQRQITLIFQNALLFPHLNVEQNLNYASQWSSVHPQTFQFDQVVELLELKSLLKRKAHQLSGGEAQRVSIGRALLSSPQLLLLDEPLTGLDQRLRQQVLNFIKIIKNETQIPMIYVTHHPEEIEFLQGEVVQVNQGNIQHTIKI